MKTLSLLAFSIAAPLAVCAVAPDTRFPSYDQVPMGIQVTVEPVFPASLLNAGVTRGHARVLVSVSHLGALVDSLVVAYTHEAFARAVTDVIERWRFSPMRVQGEATSSRTELLVNFEAKGVVVTMSVGDTLERLLDRPVDFVYQPCALRELDRIPTPLLADAPVYPREWRDAGVFGTTQVEFYIDETGVVRMPAVIAADHRDLGHLAVEAVRHWRFEAPTRHGRPVLVRVRQEFRFKGDS
jgi:TonB family protein